MTQIFVIARIVWLEFLRRKDVYVLFVLLGTLLGAIVSLDIFGLGGTVRYVTDAGLLLGWLFSIVIAISASARQLPREESRGTIYPLLAKPLKRTTLLLGKWLGCWSAVVLATACFYLLLAIVVLLKGGALAPIATFQAFLLHAALLGILTALSLAFSTRASFGAAAAFSAVVAGAAFAIVPAVPRIITHATGISRSLLLALYFAMPHFELFDLRQRLVHTNTSAPWGAVLEVLLYGLCWTALFMILAWLGYRKKFFKREATD